MSQNRDSIYAEPHDMLVDFAFDEKVAAVFPDMIRRSVPGYGDIIALLGLFAAEYAQDGSTLYDLGCSLGAATLSLRRRISAHGCRIVAVDSSAAMVERCRENIANDLAQTPVEVHCADIRDFPIADASVVVLNFTLQFISPTERLALLQRIYEGLRPGGILILSEKVLSNDVNDQALRERLHRAFKRANGYSELEISQKRSALENVLIPETLAAHQERLHKAGFDNVHTWFQALNFASMAALKTR